jgi:hypothetical protein
MDFNGMFIYSTFCPKSISVVYTILDNLVLNVFKIAGPKVESKCFDFW